MVSVLTSRLEKNCQRLGLGHLRLVPTTNFLPNCAGHSTQYERALDVVSLCCSYYCSSYYHAKDNEKITSRPVIAINTRNSSGDEIANVNLLYDDIVHVYTTKYNRLAHRRGHRSIYALPEAVHHYKTASNVKRNLHDKLKIPSK